MLAMRAIGGAVVVLLVGDQSQDDGQIEHGLGQGNLQEHARPDWATRAGVSKGWVVVERKVPSLWLRRCCHRTRKVAPLRLA
jgi:hypothetical protein